MRIGRVYIRNFRAFDELELDLDLDDEASQRPFSLVGLAGDNGSGKTTVLEAVRLAYQGPAGLRPFITEQARESGKSALIEVDFRFEAHEVERIRDWLPKSSIEDLERSHGSSEAHGPAMLRCVAGTEAIREHAAERANQGSAGLFATPNVRKAFQETVGKAPGWRVVYLPHDRALPKRSVEQLRKISLPHGTVLDGLSYSDFKQHLVDLEFVRLKRLEDGGPDPLALYRDLVSDLFPDKAFAGVSEDYRVLFRCDDGTTVDFDQLSSGERAVLSLVGAMSRGELRHCVYLIDEPEQHLHPRWQRELPRILKRQAEGAQSQFLLATHSVEIAAGLQDVGGAVYALSEVSATPSAAGEPS